MTYKSLYNKMRRLMRWGGKRMADVGAPRRTALLVTSGELGWAAVREQLGSQLSPGIVNEAQTIREALSLAGARRPALVLVSARLGETPTQPLVSSLRALIGPSPSIVVFAERLSPVEAAAFAQSGTNGCLLWNELTTELLAPLLRVLAQSPIAVHSRTVWPVGTLKLLSPATRQPSAVRLTPRELTVLWGLTHDLTHEQIAAGEFLSVRTVRRTVHHLQRKLAAPTSFLLGLRAGQLGLDDGLRPSGP